MKWIWRVDDVPGSPAHNMDTDAGLLAAMAEPGALPSVRVYTWDRAAVSFGRLQREEPVKALYPGLPVVRRPTGGRAVLHGEDLTISVALRLDWLPEDRRSVLTSHEFVMDPIKDALISLGLTAGYGGCPLGSQKDIVDCFALSASCDLVDSYTGKKLAGSAQRREGDALLQQVSVLGSVISGYPRFLDYLQSAYGQTFAVI